MIHRKESEIHSLSVVQRIYVMMLSLRVSDGTEFGITHKLRTISEQDRLESLQCYLQTVDPEQYEIEYVILPLK